MYAFWVSSILLEIDLEFFLILVFVIPDSLLPKYLSTDKSELELIPLKEPLPDLGPLTTGADGSLSK